MESPSVEPHSTIDLPYDIICGVIQAAALGPAPDFQTLHALAGTARAFRWESYKHIYRDIFVYSSEGNHADEYGADEDDDEDEDYYGRPTDCEFRLEARELQTLVQVCPWVADLVEGVYIRWDNNVTPCPLVQVAVPLILTFINVQRLAIGVRETYEENNWHSVPEDVSNAWMSLVKLPSVVSLRFHNMTGVPASALVACKRLHTLLLDWTYMSITAADFKAYEPIKLKRLETTGGAHSLHSILGFGCSRGSLVDLSNLTRLDIAFSILDNRNPCKVLSVLPNLSDLSMDLWGKGRTALHLENLEAFIESIHPASQARLRVFSLRYSARWVQADHAPAALISSAFRNVLLPALQRFNLRLVVHIFRWRSIFLEKLALLDDFLATSPPFPALASLELTVSQSLSYRQNDQEMTSMHYLTPGDVYEQMPRSMAKGTGLKVVVDRPLFDPQIV